MTIAAPTPRIFDLFLDLLPGTARGPLEVSDALRRVAVDSGTGQVVTVDDALPTGRPRPHSHHPDADAQAAGSPATPPIPVPAQGASAHRARLSGLLDRMLTGPVVVPDLSSEAYRPSGRLQRYLEARDHAWRTSSITRCQ